MAVHLYLSNDLNHLADQVASRLEKDPMPVFEKEHFVIQTEGMQTWLAINMAQRNAIAANYQFYGPDQLLYAFFYLAGLTKEKAWSKGQLKWLIYRLLDEKTFKTKHPIITQYYKGDDIKRLQLATETADLFDQYTIYRPDFITAWNQNQSIQWKSKGRKPIHEEWQKDLWNDTKIRLKEIDRDIDKSAMASLLKKELEKSEFKEKVKKYFPRISFFGLSTFTPFHLEMFVQSIGQITDVHFYFFNPAPEKYWYHDKSKKEISRLKKHFGIDAQAEHYYQGNPLLMNLGKTARELTSVFFEKLPDEGQVSNETTAHKTSTLLSTIQSHITDNLPQEEISQIDASLLDDGTISIADHYTALRETEGLYDYLLHQIQNLGYHPHEMVVLVTDVDKYAPFIEAVFNNAPRHKKIPFSIADRGFQGMDNPIGVLKEILDFTEEDMTSEGVLRLLESPFVSKVVEIKNIADIRRIISSTNIRCGIRGDADLETDIVSWETGLDRLMLGYAMIENNPVTLPRLDREIIPAAGISRSLAIEGFKLKKFIDILTDFLRDRQRERNLEEWKAFVIAHMDRLMAWPEKYQEEYTYVLRHLDELSEVKKLNDQKIPYHVFLHGFTSTLFENRKRGKLISGGLTFSGMIPLRTIPYKVIAILGLTRDNFPRKHKAAGYDLINFQHRYGDRNIREYDKYLFLETLLAAKEKLYLSYTGRNAKDNGELPPSQVVQELLDYISSILPGNIPNPDEKTRKHLLTKHPLYHFSSRYNGKDPRFFSYLEYGKPLDLADDQNDISEAPPEAPDSIISLQKCFKNPVEYYFKNTLKIDFGRPQVLLPESESFDLDSLDNYLLRNEIFHASDDDQIDELVRDWKLQGKLPLKNMGKAIIQELKETVKPFKKYIKTLTGKNPLNECTVSWTTPAGQIWSQEIQTYGDSIIYVCLTKNIEKHKTAFKIVIWHLAAFGTSQIKNAVFVYKNNKDIIVEDRLDIPPKEKAGQKLQQLIEWEQKAKKEILPFLPGASNQLINNRDPQKNFFKKIEKLREDDNFSISDDYLRAIDPEKIYKPYFEKPLEKGNLLYDMAQLFYGKD